MAKNDKPNTCSAHKYVAKEATNQKKSLQPSHLLLLAALLTASRGGSGGFEGLGVLRLLLLGQRKDGSEAVDARCGCGEVGRSTNLLEGNVLVAKVLLRRLLLLEARERGVMLEKVAQDALDRETVVGRMKNSRLCRPALFADHGDVCVRFDSAARLGGRLVRLWLWALQCGMKLTSCTAEEYVWC